MIISETVSLNGRTFIRTYSDGGYLIKQDGTDEVYSEAVDPVDSGRTYTETDETIESNLTEIEEKAQAYDIIMGVSE